LLNGLPTGTLEFIAVLFEDETAKRLAHQNCLFKLFRVLDKKEFDNATGNEPAIGGTSHRLITTDKERVSCHRSPRQTLRVVWVNVW
jgi:hypothetical protein